MAGGINLLMSVLLISQSDGNYVKNTLNNRDPAPSLHDDIRFSREQESLQRERGFSEVGKWPSKNGLVTIPYYFDPKTIPKGSRLRSTFDKVVKIYEAETCVRWVETTERDRQPKVKISRQKGCWSYVGMLKKTDNEISLGERCDSIMVILHETGHTVGLYHTQNRHDRDKYVKVWWKNMKPQMKVNFDKVLSGDTYGIPYDYKSIMHYGNSDFSSNGQFTLTTLNPFAMFSIGVLRKAFRYSDAALINKGYRCDKTFAKKCPALRCKNGGYIGQDCKCNCPENTLGDRCEVVTGDFFSDLPKCGGEITTPGYVSNGYGTKKIFDKCIFKIVAPDCKLPLITLEKVNFEWKKCKSNLLAVETSEKHFGSIYCNNTGTSLGKPIVSTTKRANLYYYSVGSNSSDIGFKARIQFVKDSSCH